MRLIEYITTLWKGQGNPSRMSLICNSRRDLPSRGRCNSWTLEWDSLVPFAMWSLIIFPMPVFSVNFPSFSVVLVVQVQHYGIAFYDNVMLLVTPWCIINFSLNDSAKMLSHLEGLVRRLRIRHHFPGRVKFSGRVEKSHISKIQDDISQSWDAISCFVKFYKIGSCNSEIAYLNFEMFTWNLLT